MKKRILFVSHETHRTGAPIVLLTFLNWLKSNTNVEITILLKEDGPLLKDFSHIAKTYIWNANIPHKYSAVRILSKLNYKLTGRKITRSFPTELDKEKFDLIYLNTIASLDFASLLKSKFNCPVIAHIHENEFTIRYHYADFLNHISKANISHYIAVSNSTKQNLIDKHDLKANDISVINPFVSIDKFNLPDISATEIKNKLGLSNHFVVGGSGLSTWRKGIDLFVQIATIIAKKSPEIDSKFLWIGNISREFACEFEYEADRLQIKDKVIFTGSVSNPQSYFQIFDLFILTSREDPFPLVCLEAASLAKPVVCFGHSGGMPEFLNKGGGIIIPYGNTDAMANQIVNLYNNRDVLKRLGKEAKNRVQEFDVTAQAPNILKVLQGFLN